MGTKTALKNLYQRLSMKAKESRIGKKVSSIAKTGFHSVTRTTRAIFPRKKAANDSYLKQKQTVNGFSRNQLIHFVEEKYSQFKNKLSQWQPISDSIKISAEQLKNKGRETTRNIQQKYRQIQIINFLKSKLSRFNNTTTKFSLADIVDASHYQSIRVSDNSIYHSIPAKTEELNRSSQKESAPPEREQQNNYQPFRPPVENQTQSQNRETMGEAPAPATINHHLEESANANSLDNNQDQHIAMPIKLSQANTGAWKKIGSGNFGIVYKVEVTDPRLKAELKKLLLFSGNINDPCFLAVKRPRNPNDPEFVKECKTTEDLRAFSQAYEEKNQQKCNYSHGTTALCEENNLSTMSIISQFEEGGAADSYFKALKKSPIQNRERPIANVLLSTFADIMQSMQQMHSAGYLHLDIAARNILIGNGTAKLADYGLSKKIGANLDDTIRISDPSDATTNEMPLRWADAIRLAGQGADRASDLYSLKVTFIELLAIASGIDFKSKVCNASSAVQHAIQTRDHGNNTSLTWMRGNLEFCLNEKISKNPNDKDSLQILALLQAFTPFLIWDDRPEFKHKASEHLTHAYYTFHHAFHDANAALAALQNNETKNNVFHMQTPRTNATHR